MDKELFLSLNLNQRAEYVWQLGEFISTINYYGFKINLYVVLDTFIEVYYNVHNNQIEEIEILETTEQRLNLYSSEVDIQSVTKLL